MPFSRFLSLYGLLYPTMSAFQAAESLFMLGFDAALPAQFVADILKHNPSHGFLDVHG
jgi:hypothetical protein